MNDQSATSSTTEEMANAAEVVWDKLQGWWEGAIALLPNLVVAILVMVAFALLAKLTRKLTQKFLTKVTSSVAISRLLARLASIAVIVIGLFIALGALQLDKTVTSLLAGAGVIGIALAFAFQDLAANLIAGIYMSFRRPFVPGDLVETNDTFGTVDQTDLRNTFLRTPQGQLVMLPNKEIFENKLVNFTRSGNRRVDLPVGVSYGEDLENVAEVTRQAITAMESRDPNRDVEVFFTDFGDSSINLVVRFWIDFSRQADFQQARSEAIMRIKRTYDASDIMIPFPIRTLDFGIKGGENVREALGPVLEAGALRSRSNGQEQAVSQA